MLKIKVNKVFFSQFHFQEKLHHKHSSTLQYFISPEAVLIYILNFFFILLG